MSRRKVGMKAAKKVKNLKFLDGDFHICASVAPKTLVELREDLESLIVNPPDLMEWRTDYIAEEPLVPIIKEGIQLIKRCFPELPLILTFRKSSEGGQSQLDEGETLKLREEILLQNELDIVDIELACIEKEAPYFREYRNLITTVKEKGVLLILSHHNFTGVPSEKTIMDVFEREQSMGADIGKVALMARSEEDMKIVEAVSEKLHANYPIPHILLAMGEYGANSRFSREKYYSAVTFASVRKATAPGQFSVEELRMLRNK